MNQFICIILPLIGTMIGSFFVFFMRNKINSKSLKFLLGFSSGVMIAASIWSLIIPSIELAEKQKFISFLPATIGFLLGIILLIVLDKIVNKMNFKSKNTSKKTAMMILAITLHNIPEGMAVGVAVAGATVQNAGITLLSAFILSIGIAIQNIPEGAIISMPLKSSGMSKLKSFCFGSLSGVVEPIFALITILLTNFIVHILPYFLSFAAGAMFYVVFEELVPECSDNKSKIGIIGITIGFLVMMILDVTLG